MKRLVLTVVMPAAFLGSGLAQAAPRPRLPSLPHLPPLPRDIPHACAPTPSHTTSAVFGAHVAVANCMAEVAMGAVAMSPDDASIARLNAAVAPSLAVLDAVVGAGDPYWKMIADEAKGDLYIGMVVRMRAATPASDLLAHAALEPKLAPWLFEATHAMNAVSVLAGLNPTIATRDAVIANIVKDASGRGSPRGA